MAALERGSASDNVLTMTQALIANMLGVRREGVTAAAGKLQDLGHPLHAWPYHDNRSARARKPCLRMLRRGQEGVRPPAVGQDRAVT